MELVVLFIIAALLFLGPRKGGPMPSKTEIGLGLFFLLWVPRDDGHGLHLEALLRDDSTTLNTVRPGPSVRTGTSIPVERAPWPTSSMRS